ncbi:hypothetical protein P3521_03650 [Vibrio parahaemolyticus]|nr:hypothetical protein [Vibrio parahaemolyticus]HAV1412755.1 hypothetical protein [Vibrio parahaemolyticus]HAV2004838.1 hypothetical protein [Vibrio parahaemolyticus]
MTSYNTVISQLKTEEELLTSLGSKLEKTAQWMMAASGKPEFRNRQDVYYPLLNEWREQKAKVNTLYVQRANLLCIDKPTPLTVMAKMMEEKRAIKEATVTCTTYERAQRRLFKQVNGFLSGN